MRQSYSNKEMTRWQSGHVPGWRLIEQRTRYRSPLSSHTTIGRTSGVLVRSRRVALGRLWSVNVPLGAARYFPTAPAGVGLSAYASVRS